MVAANTSTTCEDCLAGKYSEEVAANSSDTCLDCIAGKYSEVLAAQSSHVAGAAAAIALECLPGAQPMQLVSAALENRPAAQSAHAAAAATPVLLWLLPAPQTMHAAEVLAPGAGE